MMLLFLIALSCGGSPADQQTSAWGGKPGFPAPSVILIASDAVAETTVEEDSAAVQVQVKEMNEQAANQIAKMDKLIAELKKQ
jgi:hypothetical protein